MFSGHYQLLLIQATETQWELAEAQEEGYCCRGAARTRDNRNQVRKHCRGLLLLSSLSLSTSSFPSLNLASGSELEPRPLRLTTPGHPLTHSTRTEVREIPQGTLPMLGPTLEQLTCFFYSSSQNTASSGGGNTC